MHMHALTLVDRHKSSHFETRVSALLSGQNELQIACMTRGGGDRNIIPLQSQCFVNAVRVKFG